MNAYPSLDWQRSAQDRSAELRVEAQREREARQAQAHQNIKPAPVLNLRALLVRLRLA